MGRLRSGSRLVGWIGLIGLGVGVSASFQKKIPRWLPLRQQKWAYDIGKVLSRGP